MSATALADAPAGVPQGLGDVAMAAGDRTTAGLRGGAVYTDDKAPVEWLIDESIVQVAANGHR
jgi:hypothetical protein